MKNPLTYYIGSFGRLNCHRRQGETAPHKAVMLLAVIEEVQAGHITNGFVPLNVTMVNAFNRVWRRYVGKSDLFNPAFHTPFYHLGYEPFWELMKREPFRQLREYSLPSLRENFFGAKIPDELCEYMADPASSRLLKRALLEKYLPDHEYADSADIAAEASAGYGTAGTSDVVSKHRA